MFGRRNSRQALRNNIEDDCIQTRSDSLTKVENMAHHAQEDNGFSINSIPSVHNHRQTRNSQKEYNRNQGDITSGSEDDVDDGLVLSRLRLLRNLSDHEMGESSHMKPSMAKKNHTYMSKRKVQGSNEASHHHFVDSESSSDDDIRSTKKVKRPLSPTSSSDTSDSGIPIVPKRSIKRMRIFSSSENSSSESLSEENNSNEAFDKNVENNVTSADIDLPVYEPSRNANRDNRKIIRATSDSESDSEINVTSISHTVRGRRKRVIESEDDDNPPTGHSGSRNQEDSESDIDVESCPDYTDLNRAQLYVNSSPRMLWINPGEDNRIPNIYYERRRPQRRRTRVIGRRTRVIESEGMTVISYRGRTPRVTATIPLWQSNDSISIRPVSPSNNSSSSSSSSDSDDSIPIRNTRRRRRPQMPVILDRDYDDELHGMEINIKASTVKEILASRNTTQHISSSDTDSESEKCPICFSSFKSQQIGKPKSCEHMFCCTCIKEWATKNNTCPVDRKVFNGLVVYSKFKGNTICEVPIVKPEIQSEEEFDLVRQGLMNAQIMNEISDDDDSLWALDREVCFTCGHRVTHQMISCDDCNSVFHLNCVDLQDIPSGYWCCSNCEIYSD